MVYNMFSSFLIPYFLNPTDFEEKLKIEEEYAKSKAKAKILEAIESEDHKREFNVDGHC